MQLALLTTYYLAWWCIVTALSIVAAAAPFMARQDTGLDDGLIGWIGMPIGLLIFVPVARRALRLRRLHRYLLGIGGVGVIAAVAMGIVLLRRSEALTGVAGPFAGFGELVVAISCFLAGLFFLAVAVAGATGIRIGRGQTTGQG